MAEDAGDVGGKVPMWEKIQTRCRFSKMSHQIKQNVQVFFLITQGLAIAWGNQVWTESSMSFSTASLNSWALLGGLWLPLVGLLNWLRQNWQNLSKTEISELHSLMWQAKVSETSYRMAEFGCTGSYPLCRKMLWELFRNAVVQMKIFPSKFWFTGEHNFAVVGMGRRSVLCLFAGRCWNGWSHRCHGWFTCSRCASHCWASVNSGALGPAGAGLEPQTSDDGEGIGPLELRVVMWT